MKNRFKLNASSGAFLLLWLAFGVLSYLFADTGGLIFPSSDMPGGYGYISDLQGAAGNDNLCIEIGVVTAVVGVSIALLRLAARFGIADIVIHGILLLIQFLYLVAIEAGSIVGTLTHRNTVLALWVVCYLLLVGYWLQCIFRGPLRAQTSGT